MGRPPSRIPPWAWQGPHMRPAGAPTSPLAPRRSGPAIPPATTVPSPPQQHPPTPPPEQGSSRLNEAEHRVLARLLQEPWPILHRKALALAKHMDPTLSGRSYER